MEYVCVNDLRGGGRKEESGGGGGGLGSGLITDQSQLLENMLGHMLKQEHLLADERGLGGMRSSSSAESVCMEKPSCFNNSFTEGSFVCTRRYWNLQINIHMKNMRGSLDEDYHNTDYHNGIKTRRQMINY